MKNDNFKNQIFNLFNGYLSTYKNMADGKSKKISPQKIIDVVPVKYKKDSVDKNNILYKYLTYMYLVKESYKKKSGLNLNEYFSGSGNDNQCFNENDNKCFNQKEF